MIRIIDVEMEHTLSEYTTDLVLRKPVQEMQNSVVDDVAALNGHTVWMVNSTASGGGVAEMMPKLISLFRALGVETKWAVIDVDDSAFFEFTKDIHNLLHGVGDPVIVDQERTLYEQVSRSVANELAGRLSTEDVLVVHDPQPLAAGAMTIEELGIPAVWRCHIGSEQQSDKSQAAWEFLQPWLCNYDQTIFTLPAYVPEFLQDDTTIIPPAIDPFNAKNRRLRTQEVASILTRAELVATNHPTESFDEPARRLQADGTFAPATDLADLGLLFRPIVCQISRWDSLKGFIPLLRGFAHLKSDVQPSPDTIVDESKMSSEKAVGEAPNGGEVATPNEDDNMSESIRTDAHQRRIEHARLVLAGPNPSSVADDPEGQAALEKIEETWRSLESSIQEDVAIIVMPPDQHESALVINALQRCATVVAQNSLREGFGLTVTEAMWKRAVLMGSDTGGIGVQIRDDEDGLLVPDAADPVSVANTLDAVFENPGQWNEWSHNAQRRVADKYLVFEQVTRWLDTLGTLVR
ncbi:glycosyltransferase [Haladaptatus halobius]|uniref:glycosyltransferase n=1 Tax=Haladaptatus halobius TaxID=2884875 RepID=UPI001D0BAE21|nr:glycosyltransferase [Haladaptatus halobius]